MPIRVLLVEDSPIALTILKRILGSSSDIEIVGTAVTGKQALEMIPKLSPQVICTDLHMPEMNGLELTKEVMSSYPTPILVISASVQEHDTKNVFELLDAGAVDLFPKPQTGLIEDYELAKHQLITKIKILSGVKVFRKHKTPIIKEIVSKYVGSASLSDYDIMAIGSSTGGPQALHDILSQLPDQFPLPIICIQHISEGFLSGLIGWLSNVTKLSIQIAKVGEKPKAGYIYFPPERLHLEFDSKGQFIYSNQGNVDGHQPSITVTFKSIAGYYGKRAIAILLTGMGKDGASGMLSVCQSGGLTIAQDEKTSIVFGMPQEAIKLKAAQVVLPITQIAPYILSKLSMS